MKLLLNLLFFFSFPLLSSEEFKEQEDDRADYLPNNILPSSVNRLSEYINSAYQDACEKNIPEFNFIKDLSSLTLSYLNCFEEISELIGHSKEIVSFRWSQDSKQIISSSLDNTIRTWDVESGYQISHKNCFIENSISPDLKKNVHSGIFGNSNRIIRYTAVIINTSNGSVKTGLLLYSKRSEFHWSNDGSILFIICEDNSIIGWSKFRNDVFGRSDIDGSIAFWPFNKTCFKLVNDQSIEKIECSLDNKFLACLLTDSVRIWNLKDFTCDDLPFINVNNFKYSNDGKFLALAFNDCSIIIINTQTHEEVFHLTPYEKEYLSHNSPRIRLLSWSKDSKLLATADVNKAKIIDVQSGKQLDELCCNSYVDNIVWSPNNCYLAVSVGLKNKIIIYSKNAR